MPEWIWMWPSPHSPLSLTSHTPKQHEGKRDFIAKENLMQGYWIRVGNGTHLIYQYLKICYWHKSEERWQRMALHHRSLHTHESPPAPPLACLDSNFHAKALLLKQTTKDADRFWKTLNHSTGRQHALRPAQFSPDCAHFEQLQYTAPCRPHSEQPR